MLNVCFIFNWLAETRFVLLVFSCDNKPSNLCLCRSLPSFTSTEARRTSREPRTSCWKVWTLKAIIQLKPRQTLNLSAEECVCFPTGLRLCSGSHVLNQITSAGHYLVKPVDHPVYLISIAAGSEHKDGACWSRTGPQAAALLKVFPSDSCEIHRPTSVNWTLSQFEIRCSWPPEVLHFWSQLIHVNLFAPSAENLTAPYQCSTVLSA